MFVAQNKYNIFMEFVHWHVFDRQKNEYQHFNDKTLEAMRLTYVKSSILYIYISKNEKMEYESHCILYL